MSNTLNDDKKQIERLLKKYDIKEANGMNSDHELTEMVQIMAANISTERVESYKKTYKELALSLLNEPLSDIPMGRTIQFATLLECEYKTLKNVFYDYKKCKCSASALVNQYKRYNAALECICEIFVEHGDHKSTIHPYLDELDSFQDNDLVDIDETDVTKYIEALEYEFNFIDFIITCIRKAIESNDSALMNAIAFCVSPQNVYIKDLIEFIAIN